MKIFIIGGGSGGHIMPAITIGEKIENISKNKILYICSRNKLDQEIFINNNKKFYPLYTGKLRRYFSWKNFLDLGFFLYGFIQSFILLLKQKPKVIFSKGGYVSLPMGLAAKILKIPLVLHESDQVMGLANRLLAKIAQKVLTGFPFENKKFHYVGNPVKKEILQAKIKNIDKDLGFEDKNKKIILILGGSQGAENLNKIIWKSFFKIKANFVVLCGKGKNIFKKLPRKNLHFSEQDSFHRNLKVFEFVNSEKMGFLLQKADLVISRAGAGTIADVAALEKPLILIPLKNSACDHQRKNAQKLASQKAALYWEEDEIAQNEKFIKMVNNLLQDAEKIKILTKNIAQFYHKNAAENIAKEILKLI